MVTRAAGTKHLPSRCEVASRTSLQEDATSLSLPEVTFENISPPNYLECLFITQAI